MQGRRVRYTGITNRMVVHQMLTGKFPKGKTPSGRDVSKVTEDILFLGDQDVSRVVHDVSLRSFGLNQNPCRIAVLT